MVKRIFIFSLHLVLIVAASEALALATTGFNLQWGFATSIVLAFLFGSFAVHFIRNAEMRYAQISDSVSVELNKLRRIHHLARAFSRSENQIPWFDLVREAIESYLHAFEVIPFTRYDDTNEMFRRITQQLYGFDKIVSKKGELLFAELMTISGQATEARQRIHELRSERLGVWGTGVLWSLTIALAVVILFSYGDDLMSRLVAGGLVAIVALVLDYIHSVDKRTSDSHKFTQRYVANIERMGFWPEEKM